MTRKRSFDIKFEIDWDGDGRYQNRLSNITEKVIKSRVRFGCDVSFDSYEVKPATANGTLSLDNLDGLYDSDNPQTFLLDVEQLNRRNAIRITYGDDEAWSGVCFVLRKNREEITFALEGKYNHILARNDQELNLEVSTLQGVSQAFSAESGIEFDVSSEQPTGLVYFRGPWLDFFDDYGKYGGGFVTEGRDGEFKFTKFADIRKLPEDATLDLSYEPDYDGFMYEPQAGHVRNQAICRSFAWRELEGSQVISTNDVLIAASSENTNIPQQKRTVRLEFKKTLLQRPRSWDTFTAKYTSGEGDDRISGDCTVENIRRLTRYIYDVDVVTPRLTKPFPLDVVVTATGKVEERRELTSRVLNVRDQDTQDVFGVQSLNVPPWFPSNYAGINLTTLPWLRNLSFPPGYIDVSYDEFQDSLGKGYLLRDSIVPGNIVNFHTVIRGKEVVHKSLILSVELTYGHNRMPKRRVQAINSRVIFEPQFEVEIEDVTDTRIQLLFRDESPTGSNHYIRYRAKGRETYVTLLPFSLDTKETIQNIEGLTAETTYEVQTSRFFDFRETQDLEIMTLPPISRRLSRVTINGVDIIGWNYFTTNDFTVRRTFLSTDTIVTIEAFPEIDTNRVTITPNGVTMRNGESQDFTISVLQGQTTRDYKLTVQVLAPSEKDINTLSGRMNLPESIAILTPFNSVFFNQQGVYRTYAYSLVFHTYIPYINEGQVGSFIIRNAYRGDQSPRWSGMCEFTDGEDLKFAIFQVSPRPEERSRIGIVDMDLDSKNLRDTDFVNLGVRFDIEDVCAGRLKDDGRPGEEFFALITKQVGTYLLCDDAWLRTATGTNVADGQGRCVEIRSEIKDPFTRGVPLRGLASAGGNNAGTSDLRDFGKSLRKDGTEYEQRFLMRDRETIYEYLVDFTRGRFVLDREIPMVTNNLGTNNQGMEAVGDIIYVVHTGDRKVYTYDYETGKHLGR